MTGAAARVHLSQSAVSAILAQLRDHFEDELLVKSGRSLVLTPFAKTLIVPLAALMSEARDFAARRPEQRLQNIERDLVIAASDAVFEMCLADAIRALTAAMPGVRFDIRALSADAAQLLQDGLLDLVVAGDMPGFGLPPTKTVFQDKLVCMTCAKTGPDHVDQDRFHDHQRVVVRYDPGKPPMFDDLGHPIDRPMIVSSYAMVAQMICGSNRLAVVPERVAKQASDRWPVRVHPYPFDAQHLSAHAFWHPSRARDEVLMRFVALLA